MAVWKKKDVAKEVIKEISTRYDCNLITASILARRGITHGKDILYYMENDLRFLHNPFLFEQMEDAVDRILDAVQEGEKVLVFGDRDVDGITSTIILYECLKSMGLDVSYKVPSNDESYGLSFEAIDDFASKGGTLIITVDCGISNKDEILYANEKFISVIVTDHHNPPEELPQNTIILNPKLQNSGYPYKDISGCTVSYKLVQALRFAQCEMYKQEICLMNVRPINEAYIVECIKVINMSEKDRLVETVSPGLIDIRQTRLIPFLTGQQIYVWDKQLQQKMLNNIFGKGVEFNLMDIRPEISKVIPSISNFSLLRLKDLSKLARYNENLRTELEGFFNIFITYVMNSVYKATEEQNQFDLQLVALAAIADIMPLQNENRILVKQGLISFNSGKIRPGLQELFANLNLLGKKITSKDLGWTIVPCLNATGRMGEPETALKLFTVQDPVERNNVARAIIELNKQRKNLGSEALKNVFENSFNSLAEHNNNLCVVYDNRVNRGVTGIVASKLVSSYKVPSIIITEVNENAVGSARSARGYNILNLMNQCSDLFLKYGGHDFAGGFSLEKSRIPDFLARLKNLSALIEFDNFESADEIIEISAELPANYVNKDILGIIEQFEPYGNQNSELNFLTRNVKITNTDMLGKNGSSHLKLTLDIGGTKWPAIYWNSSEKYNKDFTTGDMVDVIYNMETNIFNGMENLQLVIKDIARYKEHEIK
ncbi:MAG: single-stranded-DNA-specific exonuclease RecJ [Treponemataceae bacterium]